jgi:hypothetical protein
MAYYFFFLNDQMLISKSVPNLPGIRLLLHEPIRLYLIKYLFQTGINSARGVRDREPIRYQPLLWYN